MSTPPKKYMMHFKMKVCGLCGDTLSTGYNECLMCRKMKNGMTNEEFRKYCEKILTEYMIDFYPLKRKRYLRPKLKICKSNDCVAKPDYKHFKVRSKKLCNVVGLSEMEFYQVCKEPCEYCKYKPANGIDRIDSGECYSWENAAACCQLCNMVKRDMTVDEFYNKIFKVCLNDAQ